MRRATLVLSILGLLMMASSSPAAGTAITAPRTARIGQRITVSAHGLISGDYALTLVSDSHITNGGSCVARLSPTRATTAGTVRLSGTIPAKLTCYQAASINLGRVAAAIGGYHLVVAEPTAPDGFDAKGSFVRSALRITG